MRKSRRDFHKETRRPPFELELDEPVEDGKSYVTFKDPNKLSTRSAFQLARESDPEEQVRLLLSGDDFAAWWNEWAEAPVDETNALLEELFDHYGASKSGRSG